MKTRFWAATAVVLLLATHSSWSWGSTSVPLDSLKPSPEHVRATAIVLDFMQRYHYKRQPLSDALSSQIFNRYLDSLDGQKNFFLTSDIAEFEPMRRRFDDALRQGRLDPAFIIFKRFRQRVGERSEYALSLLDTRFDFTRDEDYNFDREDAAWAKSKLALNELWRKTS